MSKITKEQLGEIIESSKRMLPKNESVRVYSGDEWKKNEKLSEKIHKSFSRPEDIWYVVESIYEIIIYGKECVKLPFKLFNCDEEYLYSDLLLLCHHHKKNKVKKEKTGYQLYWKTDGKMSSKYFSCSKTGDMLMETINNIVFAENDVTTDEEMADFLLASFRNAPKSFSVWSYCFDMAKEKDFSSSELMKYIAASSVLKSVFLWDSYWDKLKIRFNTKLLNPVNYVKAFSTKALNRSVDKTKVKVFYELYENSIPYLKNGIEHNVFAAYTNYFELVNLLLELNGTLDAKYERKIVSEFNETALSLAEKISNKEEFFDFIKIWNTENNDTSIEPEDQYKLYKLIGDIYYSDKPVINKKYAISWYKEALNTEKAQVREAYSDIMYKIAICFRDGLGGVEQDTDEMVKWLRDGANYSNGLCEYELFKYYHNIGNDIEADEWHKKAAKNGIKDEAGYKKTVIEKINETVGDVSGVISSATNLLQTGVEIYNSIKKKN